MIRYNTNGVCSRAIEYELDANNVVTSLRIIGGCAGNTAGVAKLCVGRKAEDVIALLKGIPCRGSTSCPDQVAKALTEELKRRA